MLSLPPFFSVLSALATCVAPIVCTGDGLSYVLTLFCIPHGMAGESKNWACTRQKPTDREGREKVKKERLKPAEERLTERCPQSGGGVTLTADSEGKFSFFLCTTNCLYRQLPIMPLALQTAQLLAVNNG